MLWWKWHDLQLSMFSYIFPPATRSTFPNYQLMYTFPSSISQSSPIPGSLTSPSGCNQSSPLHLWKQCASCHIKLVNVVLSLVRSLLDIVLSLPQIRISHVPAQPSATINPCVYLSSQLESGRHQKNRMKSRESCGTWLAGSRLLPTPPNTWLLAGRLIIDLPSCWEEPANGRDLVSLS